MAEQKLIVTINSNSAEDANLDVSLSYDPPIPEYKSEEFNQLSEEQRQVMIFAQHLSSELGKVFREESKS